MTSTGPGISAQARFTSARVSTELSQTKSAPPSLM
jgi:hypothetical protein